MPIVLPILAFGAAYAVIRGTESQSQPEVDTSDDVATGSDNPMTPSTNNPQWSALIEELRGDIPADFLERWMQKESGGNACTIGVFGGPWETGLGQLYFDRDEGSKRINGATLDELRAYCVPGKQQLSRDMTDDEKRQNIMATLIIPARQLIATAHDRISGIGESWSDEDIFCLAKLYHALPVLVTTHLSGASQDGHTESWDSYRAYITGMTRDELVAFDRRLGYSAGRGAAPYYPLARLFDNAQSVGRGI